VRGSFAFPLTGSSPLFSRVAPSPHDLRRSQSTLRIDLLLFAMSTNLPAGAAEGRVARVSAGEAGLNPPLSTSVPAPVFPALSTSPPTHAGSSGDEEGDDSKEDAAADGVSETEVEQESDDEASLRRDLARLKEDRATLKAQRMAALRRAIQREAAALQREAVETGTDPPVATAAAAAGEQTPARPLPRRPLEFLSTVGRKEPNAATVARQAAIGRLPDLTFGDNAVSVVIAPAVTGATVTHVPRVTAEVSTASKLGTKASKPSKFSGDNPVQNERVAGWVAEINRYFDLCKVPAEDHLSLARSYITSEGSAQEWIMAREEEVTFLGKRLTWDWLQTQLIQHYAQPSGAAAMQAEWQALRMGIKGADGTDTGKSTWSVKSYTNRFLHYMRLLTTHTVQTSDVLVIDRYVLGIRTGYEVLYRVMLGVQRVLRFASLQEAISAAEEAEAEISISKISARPLSSSSSRYGESAGRGAGSGRALTESLNNLQGEYDDEGEGQETAPRTPRTEVNGFRYNPGPADGRHRLTEKEQRMLYDEKRCYRCYGQHPVGIGKPTCTKPVQKIAPRPLK
jgi:hypothetical protein